MEHFTENLYRHPDAEHAREYVRSRGFKGPIVKQMRLGFALESWEDMLQTLGREGINAELAREAGLVRPRESGGMYDVFRNRIMFPIVDVTDRVVGFGGRTLDADNPAKYVNSEETPLFQKRRMLYGLDVAAQAIKDAGHALIVEGYTDVLALRQAGVENAVAGLGTALTAEQLHLLARYCDEVALIYDGDSAGASAALRNLEVLEGAKVSVGLVMLPEGMDPDDFVKQHGGEGLRALLEERISPVDYQLKMIFAAHADKGADGRTRAAHEAVETLLKVPDRARRDDYLARAADLWGQSDPGRTESMQRVLRLELNRKIAELRGRAQVSGARDRGFITQTLAKGAPGPLAAETELLSLALDDEEVARRVVAELTPQDIVVPADGVILQALTAQLADGGHLDAGALVDGLVEEGGAKERGVELLVAQSVQTKTTEERQELVRASIQRLRDERLAGRQTVRFFGDDAPPDQDVTAEEFEQLGKRVDAGINSGELTSDDPVFKRYVRLAARMRRTNDGYAQDNAKPEEPPPDPARQEALPPPVSPPQPQPRHEDQPWAAEEGDPFAEENEEL
jgi:DNA primase